MRTPTPPSEKSKKSPQALGEIVRKVMTRKGLTQRDLAKRARKSANTINNLVQGRHKQSRATIEAVATVLETSPEELGYRSKRPLRASSLNAKQRELIDELLSLPADEQEEVRRLVAKMRREREWSSTTPFSD